MTGNFCENIDNRLIALFLLWGATIGRPLSGITNKPFFQRPSFRTKRYAHYTPVIPSEVEESRGNERGGLTTTMPSF